MRFSDCQIVKENSKNLIGRPIGRKEFVPNQIWIIPKREESMRKFMTAFFGGIEITQIEKMFQNEDLKVIAVNTELLRKTHVLFYHLIQE